MGEALGDRGGVLGATGGVLGAPGMVSGVAAGVLGAPGQGWGGCWGQLGGVQFRWCWGGSWGSGSVLQQFMGGFWGRFWPKRGGSGGFGAVHREVLGSVVAVPGQHRSLPGHFRVITGSAPGPHLRELPEAAAERRQEGATDGHVVPRLHQAAVLPQQNHRQAARQAANGNLVRLRDGRAVG